MHISTFPTELFEEIFSYLPLEDLLSCCLVNKTWRSILNTNRIWSNLCAKRYCVSKKDDILLGESPFPVDPVFAAPGHTCNTMEEICPWRLRFMQEVHLSKNWRHGRFTSFPVSSSFYPMCTECDNDVLVALGTNRTAFSCYDINGMPRLVKATQFSLTHVSANFFKLCGEKLVVAQCTLLQVYIKDKQRDNIFELSHRFIFNKPESESFSIPHTHDITDWYNFNIGLYPSDIHINCEHNGDYFVGFVQEGNLNHGVFHIWDLNSGHKTTEQILPKTDDVIINIHLSLNLSNLHILMKLSDGIKEHTEIRCFNLNTFKYTDLCLSFSYVVPIVLFGDKFVLNIDNSLKTLWIWKNRDGAFFEKLSCDFIIHPETVQCVSSLIIIAGNMFIAGNMSNKSSKCHGAVKVFNTDSVSTVSEFFVDYRVSNLRFVRASLVLVCGWMQVGLWDMTTATKLHTFSYLDCLWISPCNTRTLVKNVGELILLQFW